MLFSNLFIIVQYFAQVNTQSHLNHTVSMMESNSKNKESKLTLKVGDVVKFYHSQEGIAPIGYIERTVCKIDTSNRDDFPLTFENAWLVPMSDQPVIKVASLTDNGLVYTNDNTLRDPYDYALEDGELPGFDPLAMSTNEARKFRSSIENIEGSFFRGTALPNTDEVQSPKAVLLNPDESIFVPVGKWEIRCRYQKYQFCGQSYETSSDDYQLGQDVYFLDLCGDEFEKGTIMKCPILHSDECDLMYKVQPCDLSKYSSHRVRNFNHTHLYILAPSNENANDEDNEHDDALAPAPQEQPEESDKGCDLLQTKLSPKVDSDEKEMSDEEMLAYCFFDAPVHAEKPFLNEESQKVSVASKRPCSESPTTTEAATERFTKRQHGVNAEWDKTEAGLEFESEIINTPPGMIDGGYFDEHFHNDVDELEDFDIQRVFDETSPLLTTDIPVIEALEDDHQELDVDDVEGTVTPFGDAFNLGCPIVGPSLNEYAVPTVHGGHDSVTDENENGCNNV
jgi:hypothetical protein